MIANLLDVFKSFSSPSIEEESEKGFEVELFDENDFSWNPFSHFEIELYIDEDFSWNFSPLIPAISAPFSLVSTSIVSVRYLTLSNNVHSHKRYSQRNKGEGI